MTNTQLVADIVQKYISSKCKQSICLHYGLGITFKVALNLSHLVPEVCTIALIQNLTPDSHPFFNPNPNPNPIPNPNLSPGPNPNSKYRHAFLN